MKVLKEFYLIKPKVIKTIYRSLLFSLEFSNYQKKLFLWKLWEEYRDFIEYVINRSIKEDKILRYKDIKDYDNYEYLSSGYKLSALSRVNEILKPWFKFKNKNKLIKHPGIRNIIIRLSGNKTRLFKFEKNNGKSTFDYWLKLRDIKHKEWVSFPIKSYKYANKYLEDDEWKLCNTIEIIYKNNKWFLKLLFKKQIELKHKDEIKGIDIGYRKLITTSDGKFYGTHIKDIIEKELINKKVGSKNWLKKKTYLKHEINKVLKKVFDGSFSPVLENLKNLSKDRKNKFSLEMIRRLRYWNYPYILKRIKELCESREVLYYTIPFQNTSRICPQCKYEDKLNRRKDIFKCLRCGYIEDSDIVGSKNILSRFIEECVVPLPTKSTSIIKKTKKELIEV